MLNSCLETDSLCDALLATLSAEILSLFNFFSSLFFIFISCCFCLSALAASSA